MANLIINWLNNELKLSKKINIIEDDFSNGYYFGEIMYKTKQINNFKDYKNKDDIDNKTNNFRMIERSFKELSIKLERAKLEDILNKKRGAAIRFLYQLKMALAKKEISFEDIMIKRAPSLLDDISNNTSRPFMMNDLDMQKPPVISNPLNTMKNKPILNPLQTDNNPVNRFEKFQKQQEKIIKVHNDFQESILKNEKNASSSKNFKSIDRELFTHSSDRSKEKIPQKPQEENKEKDQNHLKITQKEELFLEMRNESTLYNSKILQNLNLHEKNSIVNLDNFERNIISLGLELSHIDPKLKKLSNSKIGKEILIKKIKCKVKEASEMTFFKNNQLGGRIKTQNPNDFVGRFKPALSVGNLTLEAPKKTSSNLNPIEKRNEYEDHRNIINRNYLREKKRKIHEMDIKIMHTEYDIMPLARLSTQQLRYDTFNGGNKENLPERQKELALKIKKRKKNKLVINQLANYIIDFVEEIYCYQIDKGDSKIYLDDWRNWSSMFINNEPFALAQKANIEYFEQLNSTEDENLKQSNISKSNLSDSEEIDFISKDTTYEECELMDYLSYRGRFTSVVIPENDSNKCLDFFEIMGADYIRSLQENNKIKEGIIRNTNRKMKT